MISRPYMVRLKSVCALFYLHKSIYIQSIYIENVYKKTEKYQRDPKGSLFYFLKKIFAYVKKKLYLCAKFVEKLDTRG